MSLPIQKKPNILFTHSMHLRRISELCILDAELSIAVCYGESMVCDGAIKVYA